MKNGIAKRHLDGSLVDMTPWKGRQHSMHVKDGARGVADKQGKIKYETPEKK